MAILAFCGINFTVLHNHDIGHLLTIGHDYPVPVDKHDSGSNFTPSPDPLGWVQGQIFLFHNN